MAELNWGQIIFMVGFIVLLLIRFLRQRARRRPEDQVADQTVAEGTPERPRRQAQAAPALPPSTPPPSTPRAFRGRVHESPVPDVGAPLGGGHFIKKSLLESPCDVRRGIILMTILGPCRAFDPRE